MFVLLNTFLGLKHSVIIDDETLSITIKINDQIAEFRSTFFDRSDNLELSIKDCVVSDSEVKMGSKSLRITSLFSGDIEVNNDVRFPIDILGSTFFMLTRYEEHVNPMRDEHGRFPTKESLAYKHGFLHRPIVNEYVELLWAILQEMGCTQLRKRWNYKLVPTHDVDIPFLFDGIFKSLRSISGFIKRGRYAELGRYVSHRLTNRDPFDTYDMFMDLSEKQGVKSNFFFLQKGSAKQDKNNNISSPKIRKLIKHIKFRGHNVGFHPSYNAYNDPELYQSEKNKLEEVVGEPVVSGRNHYLRWDVAKSPRLWENNEMSWDSTLGYADHAGFRCGVCYPFPLYDLENDCQLDVHERPLIAMEWSLIHYQGLDLEGCRSYIDLLRSEVKKYQGEFVFLYHNSSFFVDEYYYFGHKLIKLFFTSSVK